MIPALFFYLFFILSVIGIILYFIKSKRNISYILFTFSFFALGIAGTLNNEMSAGAAFLLAVVAARQFRTKFDKR